MRKKEHIDRNGFGRRRSPALDGCCSYYNTHEKCFEIIKKDIKEIEDDVDDLKEDVAAVKPVVQHNQQEIDSMRKLQLTTLVSALISALGIIAMLIIMLEKANLP